MLIAEKCQFEGEQVALPEHFSCGWSYHHLTDTVGWSLELFGEDLHLVFMEVNTEFYLTYRFFEKEIYLYQELLRNM